MTRSTPEQKLGSDPLASVWVAASAGTGKTFVLTNRVLHILLTGTLPERILCLTFTKAAAAEMANRINKRLGEWVTCDRQKLCEEIADLTGEVPDRDLQDHARKLFARVLEVPGGLKIQTIHSFCQSLLGRFPLEAGIAPHFQVMDDRTSMEHLGLSRDAVLAEAIEEINPVLASALAHISHKVSEHSFAELMPELIAQRSGLERMMRKFKLVGRANLAMTKMLGLKPSDNGYDIIEAACAEGSFNEIGLRRAIKPLLTGSATSQKRAEKMANWLSSPDERAQNFEQYISAYLTKKKTILATLMPDKMAAEYPVEYDALAREAERLQGVAEKIKLVELLDNSKALLALGVALLAAFGHSKRRAGMMDYDDLILHVSDLIGQRSIADWILYKLDGGIDHILIDEAQDTNPEQWQVIKALANEFFTGEGQSEAARTLFAVGDVKQSIYSFQRADPREFVANQIAFQRKSLQAEKAFHNVQLDLSFRSTAPVLMLVDQVFAPLDRRQALSFSEDEIGHNPHRTGQAGLVELWPTEPVEILPEPDDWQPPVIQQSSHSPQMKLAVRIADKIVDWLAKGEKLESQNRNITAGDIMILVRRRTEFDNYMIRALKARKIPVAGQDRMVLSDQMAVMDLMAVGNFVLLPSDDLTLAVVLKSPFVGFSEDDLYDLACGRKGSLWVALRARRDERAIFRTAHDLLINLTNFADTAPPFEFYTHLLTALGGREKLLGRLGEEANDPIDEFLQLAMGFEVNNISALQGFLAWIERGDVKIKRDMEQGQDEVRIMTIHGAKGLQAPVVILPDCCQIPTKNSKLLWAGNRPDELLFWPGNKEHELGPCALAREDINLIRDQEYLRQLYVAMTRAEDRLYITGWENKKPRSEKCWYDLIQNAFAGMADVITGDGDTEGYLLRLTCGQEAPPEKKEKDKLPGVSEMPLPPWADTMPKPEPAPSRPLSPSRPEEPEMSVLSPIEATQRSQKDRQRFHRGRLIHRLLEILPGLDEDHRAEAAQQFLSQPAHGLETADIDQIVAQMTAILTNPAFSQVFSKDSRAEVPIVGLVGDSPVSGQVDRLVVSDHEILIIDYKTNRPPPEDATHVSRLYIRQMAAYKAVLSDIYPDRTIRCILLWTDVARLMELPDEMLARVKF